MLIEFSAGNFRSLRDRQTLSLVRGKGDELAESNTFKVVAHNKFELLHAAAIYGPNGGGKSNLLNALRSMRDTVLLSASRMQANDKLPVVPYRLKKETNDAPSTFEAHFIVGGVRYQYGFVASAKRVHEEWLLAYPQGRPQRWFERTWNEQRREYDWELGASLKGEKQLWRNATRDNALFLSTAVRLNSKQLRPVYDWFHDNLHFVDTEWDPAFTASLCETKAKTQVLDFLHSADLYIEDIIVEADPPDSNVLAGKAPSSVEGVPVDALEDKKQHNIETVHGGEDGRKIVLGHGEESAAEVLQGQKRYEIKTVHRGEDGRKVVLDLEEESAGAQKLFALAGHCIDTLVNGNILVVDGLNNHLHPGVVQFLVHLFHFDETNRNNPQLIFTSHDTSILNQAEFRRDQVWFCSRDKDQATRLYPLTDFSPRKGRENLEATYLSGRYGALPFVRPMALDDDLL